VRAAPFPGTFPGSIATEPDLSRLTALADFILLVHVIQVSQEARIRYLVHGEEVEFSRLVAVAEIDRVLKGASPGSRIEVEFLQSDAPTSLLRLDPGEDGILFLNRRGERYVPVNYVTAKVSPSAADRIQAGRRE
jgi:hypothetical protein